LCGLAILICGVLVEVNWRYLAPHSFVALGFIVIGGITFVIALFGCFDAIRKNRPVFITFGIFISIVLVVQIALSIYVYVERNRIQKNKVEYEYERWFYKYYKDNYSYDRVNSVQEKMNCCGIDGPDDFLKIFNATEIYHWSCCGAENVYKYQECTSSDAHQRGCHDYVFDVLMSEAKLLGGIIYGITAVELIGIILAILLAHTSRNDKRRVMTD
ncbi:hypothetical protein PV326_010439, partial [Microctonus aethiopoides]